MSYKIGLILSMIFVTLFFAMWLDMICVQIIYNDLDSKCIAISYQISQHGTIDEQLKSSIESTYKVSFTCIDNCSPKFGDVVTYQISKDYRPIIIKQETMTISVERSAIIGFYN